MTLPRELYPFSTQDGKAVPLEIIQPSAMVMLDVTTSYSTLALPDSLNLAAIFASCDCVIDLTGAATTLASGTLYNSMLFVPASTVVMAKLETVTAKIRAVSDSGTIFIQGVERWAGLNLTRQFTGKSS